MTFPSLAKGFAVALTGLFLTACSKGPLMPTSASLASRLQASQAVTSVVWPTFSRTEKDVEADPINLVVSGDERHVRHVFKTMGWLDVDPTTFVSTVKMIKSSLVGGEYPTSPMSDLYVYGRVQDMAFQKNPLGTFARDHLRVWRTPRYDGLGRPIWVVAATRDVAIKWGPGEKLPTHQISPFIDDERQMVAEDFVRSGHVAQRYQIQAFPAGFRGYNGGGDGYVTDGKVEVLELVPMKY